MIESLAYERLFQLLEYFKKDPEFIINPKEGITLCEMAIANIKQSAKMKRQETELKRQAQAWSNVLEFDLIAPQNRYSAEFLNKAALEAIDD